MGSDNNSWHNEPEEINNNSPVIVIPEICNKHKEIVEKTKGIINIIESSISFNGHGSLKRNWEMYIQNLLLWKKDESNTNYAEIIKDIKKFKEFKWDLVRHSDLLEAVWEIAKIWGWELNLTNNNLLWTNELRNIHEVENDYIPTLESAINFYDSESLPIMQKAMEEAMNNGKIFDLDLKIITAKGNIRFVNAKWRTYVYDNEVILKWTFQDITDKKHSELELIRLNRVLKIVKECNKILINIDSEKELLKNICEIVVKYWWYHMCWIGYKGDDKTLIPQAHSWFEDWYLESIRVTRDENRIDWQGPSGKAIRKGESVIIQNILTDSSFSHWRKNAKKRWYSSFISIPLKIENEIIGVFITYSQETDVFIKEEITLLEELSQDISRGVSFLRTKEENKRNAELIKIRDEKIKKVKKLKLFEYLHEALLMILIIY